jgi:hypothetical protein
MNTFTVTFYRETGDQAEDVDIRAITVESPVEADDLATGDYDAHELVVARARTQGSLDRLMGWESSHVTLTDGSVWEVPAGL